MRWQDISDELARTRQSLTAGSDVRVLGPGDFSIRPMMFSTVHRYACGRCMDFAVRIAQANPSLAVAGLHVGDDLVHAFLVERRDTSKRIGNDTTCIDVGGEWSLSEMRRLHPGNGRTTPRILDLGALERDIRTSEANDSEFDSSERVLSTAGCLPHMRRWVPEYHRIDDPTGALDRLVELSIRDWSTRRHLAETIPVVPSAP